LQKVAVTVERVAPELTFPLRQLVLRPGRSLDAILLPGEDSDTSGSFVARDGETGEVLSTASVWPEPPPWVPGSPTHDEHARHPPFEVPELALELTGPAGETCWRLRGMATIETRRGQGLGKLVLDACVAHADANGAALVWCNARERAIPFYARGGFAGLGERFNEEDFGPHLLMWRPLREGTT
jgi:GNAT superfamily N-acetyltransferase